MRKAFPAIAFVFMLLFSMLAGLMLVKSAKANPIGYTYTPFPIITINADGSITPNTGFLSRSGNVYTVTSNISGYRIDIECSNIVFDGNGHSIILKNDPMNPVIVMYNYPLGSNNVLIKNMEIISPFTAVKLLNCSYCQITNVTASSDIELGMSNNNVLSKNTGPIFINYGSENNQIIGNNITRLSISYFPGQNIIYGNNILIDLNHPTYVASENIWDNDSIGNYWSNYVQRYPNASEVGQTGIGDTPYMIDADNLDHYPVMYPLNIENGTIEMPIREAAANFSPDLGAVVGGISVFTITIIVVSLFYRHRKKLQVNRGCKG